MLRRGAQGTEEACIPSNRSAVPSGSVVAEDDAWGVPEAATPSCTCQACEERIHKVHPEIQKIKDSKD